MSRGENMQFDPLAEMASKERYMKDQQEQMNAQMRGMMNAGGLGEPISKAPAANRLLEAAEDAECIAAAIESLLASIVGASVEEPRGSDVSGHTLASVLQEVPARTAAAKERAFGVVDELRAILL